MKTVIGDLHVEERYHVLEMYACGCRQARMLSSILAQNMRKSVTVAQRGRSQTPSRKVRQVDNNRMGVLR